MATLKGAKKLDDGTLKGYCVKEKKKNRKLVNSRFGKMANGRLAAAGECEKCGTNMFKILSADDKAVLGVE